MKKILSWYLVGGIIFSVSITLLVINSYISFKLEDIITTNKSQTFTKVSNLLETFENFIYALELEMHKEGSNVIKKLGEMFKDKQSWQDLDTQKLKELAKKFNIDEIYLINENGVIEYTSYEPDVGLNLFNLDESFKEQLKKLYGSGQILSQRISLSSITGRLLKYIYYSPQNSNVIIEIAYATKRYVKEKFDEKVYNFLFKDLFSQIYSESQFVKSIDVYQLNRLNCWSIINEGKRLHLNQTFVDMFLSNPQKAIVTYENGNYVFYQCLKVSNTSSMFALPPPLVKIEFNFSSLYTIPYKIKIIVFLSALFSSIVCYFIFSFLVNKRILNRIIDISNALEQLSSENYKLNLPIYGNDEVALIAEKINKLAYEREIKRAESISAQTKLEEIKHFLFNILESLSIPVIAVDSESHILHWNKSSEKLFNIAKENAIGKSIWLTIPEFSEFRNIFIEAIKKFTPKEINRYLYIDQKNNKKYILFISITPMTIKNDVCTVVFQITDITEIEKLYEERRNVQQMQLISILSSGLAHDINNLLQAISNLSKSMLEKMSIDCSKEIYESYRTKFENILNSVNRAKELIDKLFSISKNTEFRSEVLDLRNIVKEVEKLLVLSADKSINIDVRLPKVPIYILGDQLFLVQAILNICVNGIHAMTIMRPDGQKRGGNLLIEITKLNINYENKYNIKLSISDEGVGIPKEILPKLFTPFISTKHNHQGSGLGLAVANTIIKQHKGKIEIKSEQNKGTTFEIYFEEYIEIKELSKHKQFTKDVHTITESSYQNININHKFQDQINKSTILVADDEEIIRFTLQAFFEEHNFNVILANDGLEAIEKFKKHIDEISLAILDLLMPQVNGVDTAEQILNYKPQIHIIITTGFDTEINQVQHLLRNRNVKIIQKPYDFDQLLNIIRSTLQ